jgi:Domain of unknown function (DUF5076)
LKSKELAPPPAAQNASDATEMLRAWVVNKGLQCSMRVGNDENEPILWGVLISDVARHAADALNKQHGWPKQEVLEQIREVFNSELDSPTAETSGGFTQ